MNNFPNSQNKNLSTIKALKITQTPGLKSINYCKINKLAKLTQFFWIKVNSSDLKFISI